MKIKTKLALGLSFLFAVIILLAGLGAYFAHRLAAESKAILQDNYESLEYSKNMLQATDVLQNADRAAQAAALANFSRNLVKQEANTTEVGEKEATQFLAQHFKRLQQALRTNGKNEDVVFERNSIRQNLYKITELNMQAIIRKNTDAQEAAKQVVTYLIVIGTCSVLITLTFILNFTGYIANPIRELSHSIKEIANKNYTQRLHFQTQDEFGELAESFNQMARQLDAYEHSNLAQIMFEKRRIETIINNMTDAIIGLDEKQVILFANHEATQLLNLAQADMVGKYAPDVALQNDLLRTLLHENAPTPLRIFDENKESYFTKDSIAIKLPATANEAEMPIGQVLILKNITQFRELDLAKTNFIATISHELKTPISAIKMSVKLLKDTRVGPINPEQQSLLEHIADDSDRLLRITGELLDLTQVETGNIQLHYRAVAPWEIIEYATKALQFQIEQKKITLEMAVHANLPAVNADLEKTVWVLVNLLSNAIRYSAEGGSITITARPYSGSKSEFVQFSVQDNGRGIDTRYKDRIFDKFFQVPDAEAIKGGTGLGLAISKEFITAQGGDIWLESELGQGATFCFVLPIC